MKRFSLFFGLMLALIASSMPVQAVKVYYNNPDNWTSVSAYVYSGGTENHAWPGVAMTKDNTTGLWSYEIPANLASDCNVIFNNNNNGNQYPASGGLELKGADMICWNNNIWTGYQSAAFKVYFDNTVQKWTKPHVHYFGVTESTWPGAEMALAPNETNVWVKEVPAGTVGLVFTNGDTNNLQQSADFAAVPNHKYQQSGDKGVYVEPTPVEPFTVYYDNSLSKWATPTIHYFGGATESTYPGVAMTATPGKPGIYQYTVAGGTTGILFNAGDGDATKTTDFVAAADHVYTQAGDQGDIASYTRTVDMPAALYILGTITASSDQAWATTSGIAMTKEGNTYKAENVQIYPTDKAAAVKTGAFTLVTKTGASWDVVNTADRYGATTNDAPLTPGTAADVAKYPVGVSASSAKSWTITPGLYNFVVDFEAMTITATPVEEEDVDGALIVPAITAAPGKTVNLELLLNVTEPMSAANFEVTLPACATAGTPVLSNVFPNHVLNANVDEGVLKLVVYSPTNALFPRNSGTIVTVPVTVAADAEVGEYTINVNKIEFSTATYKLVKAAAVTSKLAVAGVVAEKVELDHTQVALQIGETAQLTATVTPEDAADKTITWSSSNVSVASVSAAGLVVANAKGTAVITAACGDAYATCTVTVGKQPQTITWDQELPATVSVGQELTLTAVTNAPGLEVEYAITSGEGTIAGNKFTATTPGVVTIQARQAGNDEYAPAEPVAKTIRVATNYTEGDVNNDGLINVTDVTTTIQYLIGEAPNPFNVYAADMDADGEVTIADVTLIIDLALNQAPASSSAPGRQLLDMPSYTEEIILTGNEYKLDIALTNMEKYVATQFDVYVPAGVEVTRGEVVGRTDHYVSYLNRADGRISVIVYSDYNTPFAHNGYISLSLSDDPNGVVTVGDALVNTVENGNIVEYTARGTSATITGIEAIDADAVEGAEIFNLQGMRVANPEAGQIYIIRKGAKVQKAVIR